MDAILDCTILFRNVGGTKLANEVHCIVYGARGYLSGTYAQRNEHCTPQNTSPQMHIRVLWLQKVMPYG